MELIKVKEIEGRRLVSAKELHKFLEVKTDVILWCKRMFEYGFEEDIDYIAFKTERFDNKQIITVDYALTINCAKEISMIQRTDKGKTARLYFIECEKELKRVTRNELPKNYIQALESLLRSEKEKELLKLEAKNNAPKVETYDKFIDSDSLQSFKEVANLLGLGRNRMMKRLRDLNIITYKNIPYQRYLEAKYFEVKESVKNGLNVATTYITAKGITYLSKKLK